MIKYASFALITVFWLVMNGLLWRSEFGSGNKIAAAVPTSVVWEKILTAPDDSSLSIHIRGKKAGFLRIRPTIFEAGTKGKIASENEPEGMVRNASEYQLEFEGSLVAEAIPRSVRFESAFAYDPSMAWERFRMTAFVRPYRWEISGNAKEGELWFQSTDGETEWIRRFTRGDLRNPKELLGQVDSPVLTALLPQYLNSMMGTNSPGLSLGLKWEARREWLRIGQSRVRIYRLEARLLERHRIVVLVSRVGEILRMELPGEVKLINEVLYAS
jgi:hypothetical protein